MMRDLNGTDPLPAFEMKPSRQALHAELQAHAVKADRRCKLREFEKYDHTSPLMTWQRPDWRKPNPADFFWTEYIILP